MAQNTSQAASENIRATRAIIHLDNLKHNIALVRDLVGPDCRICMAVKANAYGHGAVEVSRCAVDSGVDFLAVAAICEGAELRGAGIRIPVLLLNQVLPEEIPRIFRYNLTPLVADRHYIQQLETAARVKQKNISVHLKIDTGMGRLGCSPGQAFALAEYINKSSLLSLGGMATHFSVADSEQPEDRVFTLQQTDVFRNISETIENAGMETGILHAANSGAIVSLPATYFDMVRPGIALYGYEPLETHPIGLKPVMELQTRLVSIKVIKKGQPVSYGRTWVADRTTRIGLLPVGYGDGYNRLLSNKGKVLIHGNSYPVIGRVCMDITMIDLGDDQEIQLYDKVSLFGPDGAGWSAKNVADETGTIPYEVTCSVSARVPRIYQD